MQLGHTLINHLEIFLWKNKKSDELFFTTFSIFHKNFSFFFFRFSFFFFLFFEKQIHTYKGEGKGF